MIDELAELYEAIKESVSGNYHFETDYNVSRGIEVIVDHYFNVASFFKDIDNMPLEAKILFIREILRSEKEVDNILTVIEHLQNIISSDKFKSNSNKEK